MQCQKSWLLLRDKFDIFDFWVDGGSYSYVSVSTCSKLQVIVLSRFCDYRSIPNCCHKNVIIMRTKKTQPIRVLFTLPANGKLARVSINVKYENKNSVFLV